MALKTVQLTSMSQIFQKLNLYWSTCSETLIQTRNYAARKGTRERKFKILKAIKAKKLARLAQKKLDVKTPKYLMRRKEVIQVPEYLENPEYLKKPIPEDDVFIASDYQWISYNLEEAISCHREFCHPTIMNKENSLLNLFVEFNLQGVKKTKPISKFTRTVAVPNIFDHKEKRIVAAFCKTLDENNEAKDAGATIVFGPPEIKEILKGTILLDDYPILVAHPSILPELTSIKGLMRKNYPNTKDDTLSPNLKEMISLHMNGIKYTVNPYPHYLEYGYSSILVGKLDMDVLKIKENCVAILKDVLTKRPKREGTFINRLRLGCADNLEKFKLDITEFIPKEELIFIKKSKKDELEAEADENSEDIAVISTV